MPAVQTRPQKSKATPKVVRTEAVMPAAKPRKSKFEAPPGPGTAIGAHEREMMVARAAYFRAEKRGFAPGNELQDWVEAEVEVLQLIGGA
jgi:hypothetical protein